MKKYRITCYVKGNQEELEKQNAIFDFLVNLPFNTERSKRVLKDSFGSYPVGTVLRDFWISSIVERGIKEMLLSIKEEYPEATLASWDERRE